MRALLFFAIFCFSVFSAYPQVVITSNDLPHPGKIYVVKYDTIPQISISNPSSQPQTWNFSQLNNHYYKVASYSPTAPAQYWAPSFPGCNMYTYGPSYMFTGLFGGAPVDQSMWGYAFWKADNTGLYTVGWRGDYGIGFRNVLENQPEMLMGTPASYNSTFNNASQWSVAFNVVSSNQDTNYLARVKKTLTADAFGQITTPYGSFNVLRMHEFFVETDSIFASISGTPIPGTGSIWKKDTLHNYYFWANGVGYPIATIHANANNVIKNIEYLDTILNTYSIHGQVFAHNSTAPVSIGKASLMAHDSVDHLFGINEEISIDNAGRFQFANVLGGSWMIRALPDTASFAAEMPTYYGDKVLWNTASILHASRDTNIVIHCVGTDSLSVNNSGTGQISGIVFADTSNMKASLIAAENINIILQKGDSLYYAKHGKTDHLGHFHFKNLPNSSYRLIVEIAGVVQDSSYEVQIMGSEISGLNFYFDSVKVHLMNVSGVPTIKNNVNKHIVVFPNPVSDKTTILFTEDFDKDVNYSVSVFDISGKEMFNKLGKTNHKIDIDCSGLKNGLYFFNLQINGTIASRGKLIVQ